MRWNDAIREERAEFNDSSPVVGVAPPDFDGNKEFDGDFGTSEGSPFTLWTHERVYFPVVYDGAEWVRSVPRSPSDEVTHHVGGQ